MSAPDDDETLETKPELTLRESKHLDREEQAERPQDPGRDADKEPDRDAEARDRRA